MAKTTDNIGGQGNREMQLDLAINNRVLIKAPNARFGQKGRVVNRFTRDRTLYAVQFDDSCVGYFERSELDGNLTEEINTEEDRSKDFRDTAEFITRPPRDFKESY